MLNKLKNGMFIVVLFIACDIGMCSDNITINQLVDLVEASKARYQNYDICFIQKAFGMSGGNLDTKSPIHVTKISLKRRNDDICVESSYFSFKGLANAKIEDIEPKIMNYKVTQNWSKKVKIDIGHPHPRGSVRHGPAHKAEIGFTVDDAIWGLYGHPWERIREGDTEIIHDAKTGYFVLRSKRFKGSYTSVWIDPSMNYIPIKYEICSADGTVNVRCECKRFEKDEQGVYLPYQYTFSDYRNNVVLTTDITNAKINSNISDEDMDFAFPDGTIVNDEIANIRYIVGDVEDADLMDDLSGPITDSVTASDLPESTKKQNRVARNDIINKKSASKNELEKNYNEARKLLIDDNTESNCYFGHWLKIAIVALILIMIFVMIRHYKKREK